MRGNTSMLGSPVQKPRDLDGQGCCRGWPERDLFHGHIAELKVGGRNAYEREGVEDMETRCGRRVAASCVFSMQH